MHRFCYTRLLLDSISRLDAKWVDQRADNGLESG
jgi:hypothetical protein